MHTRVHQTCTHTARAHLLPHSAALTSSRTSALPTVSQMSRGRLKLDTAKTKLLLLPLKQPSFLPPPSALVPHLNRQPLFTKLLRPEVLKPPFEPLLCVAPHHQTFSEPWHLPLPCPQCTPSLRPPHFDLAPLKLLSPSVQTPGSSFFHGLWPPLMFSSPSWSGSQRQPKWPWKIQIWSCTLLPQTHHAWKDSWSSFQRRRGGARVPTAPLKLHWPPHLPLCTQPAPPQGLHTSCLGQLPQTGPRSPHHLTRPGLLHHHLRTSSQTTRPKSTACYPAAPPLALLVISQESVPLPDLEFCTYSFV